LPALLREKLPLFAAAAGSGVATVYAQSHGHALAPLRALPLPARLANAVVTCVAYLRQTVWPRGLAFFYPHAGYTGASDLAPVRVAVAGALLVAVTAAVVAARKDRPYLAVGWLWYLGMLLPVLGIVQVGEQAHADRYTYLPMIGPAIATVWGIEEAVRPRGRYAVAGAALAGVLAVGAPGLAARAQRERWGGPQALCQRTSAVTERNYVAHNDLGVILAGAGRLAEAEAHFEEAVRWAPDYAPGQDNLGTSLMKGGRLDEAIARFETALRCGPYDPQ